MNPKDKPTNAIWAQWKLTWNTKTLIILALLIALEVVLSRFASIALPTTKIGFAFLPLVASAMLFGPFAAMLVGGLADFIGATLFPIGSYFLGFTITAAINGLIYGIFLYRKQTTLRILWAVVISGIVCTVGLNTLWISMLYGKAVIALLPIRVLQAGVSAGTEMILIPIVARVLFKIPSIASLKTP